MSVGEESQTQDQTLLFDTLSDADQALANDDPDINNTNSELNTNSGINNEGTRRPNKRDIPVIPAEPRRSTQMPHPSKAGTLSMEYQQREEAGRSEGHDWATNQKNLMALSAVD